MSVPFISEPETNRNQALRTVNLFLFHSTVAAYPLLSAFQVHRSKTSRFLFIRLGKPFIYLQTPFGFLALYLLTESHPAG